MDEAQEGVQTETETANDEGTQAEIADEEVPLADVPAAVKNTAGIVGGIAAGFGALLLLFKRKKKEDQ